MYKRDVAIVLVSVLAIFFSVQHEGQFSFRKAWYHRLEDKLGEIDSNREAALPAPVVSDLNGDGRLEVITATWDYHLQVLLPKPPGKDGEGFAPADVIATVSLLPQKVGVSVGRRPVALGVGYIDTEPTEKVKPPRKQVVVVVTAGWHVMCFDHNLRLMWEHTVEEKLPHHSHIAEAAVFIAPHKIDQGDRGMVVVGGSVALGDLLHRLGMGEREDPYGDGDIFREELADLDEEQRHAHSYGGKDGLQDLDQGDKFAGVDTSRHFSYFAFEGGSGHERWTHDAGSFRKDLEELAESEHPQQNYRLEATHLAGRHFGEASCRDYRESVLHVMPHMWAGASDAKLEEAHFVRHKMGHGPQKKHLAESGGVLGLRSTGKGNGPDSGPLARFKEGIQGGKAAAAAAKSSRSLKDAHDPRIQPHHHTANNTNVLNALVAHMEEGIEVIHPFSGRTICQLHLPPNVLHVDLNGDGVLDHVQAYSGMEESTDGGSGRGHPHQRRSHCMAFASSGIPPREPLFTARICQHTGGGFSGMAGWEDESLSDRLNPHTYGGQEMEVAPPAFLPLPNLKGAYGSRQHMHGILLFMTSHGEVSAFSSHGVKLWASMFPTMWHNSAIGSRQVVPTLKAMALRPHAVPTGVLAAGERTAVVLSEHGETVSTMHLPHPPILPLQVVDFNGDGLNDVMVVTREAVYGFTQVHHLGGFQYGALVLTLVIAMAVVYYTQQVEGGKRGRRPLRSTEYTD